MKRMRSMVAVLIALAMLVGACGGESAETTTTVAGSVDETTTTQPSPDTTEPPDAETTTTAAAEAEPITLRLGIFPSLDYAPVYLGQRDGVFAEYGITLEIEEIFTGTGLMSAITSGQFDLATNSVTGGVTGIVNGLPIQMVSITSVQPTEGNVEILVPDNSDIQSIADLQGHTVATINLEGLFHLGILNAVAQEGGDPSLVEAIPMGATDSGPALEAGRVDAIMIQDPFLQTIKQEYDFRTLGNPFGVLPYRIPAGAFYSSVETIDNEPEKLRRWREALDAATQYANDHPELIREIIPEYTDLTPEDVASVGIPDYSTEADEDGLFRMLSSMVDYGWMNYTPSFGQIYWQE